MDEFEHAVLIAALDGAKDFEHQFDVFLAGGHDGLLSQAVKVPDEQYLAGTLDRSFNWKCELSEKKAPFEEAVMEFRVLLEKSGYSAELVWVTPEDVLLTGKRFVYVWVPLAEENLAKAREAYEGGMARMSGVLFSMICEIDGVACCCIWSPQRYADGHQGLWSHGLKLRVQIAESKIPRKAVRSMLRWKWLAWRHRKKQSLEEFMFQ